MADQNNPNLKHLQLPYDEVLAKINNLAIDAQWDLTNSKSPKGQRDAEERLNLFGSATFIIKQAVKNPYAEILPASPQDLKEGA